MNKQLKRTVLIYKIFGKFLFLTLFLSLQVSSLSAQVTIGSDIPPNSGALLDLKDGGMYTNGETAVKGLGLPRVELTDLNKLIMSGYEILDGTTNEYAKHTGLVVYNVKRDNCILPKPIYQGLYVWDGSKWQFMGKEEEPSPKVHIYIDPRDEEEYPYREFYYMDGDTKVSAGEWMLENLRYVPNSADGYNRYIHTAESSSVYKHFAYVEGNSDGYYDPTNHPSADWDKYKKNGLFYNWAAAINMGFGIGETPNPGDVDQGQGQAAEGPATPVRGICPPYWHVPSDREWNELERVIYNNASEYSQYKDDGSSPFTPATWDAAWETQISWRGSTDAGHGVAMKSECPPYGNTTVTAGNSLSTSQGGFNGLLTGSGAYNALINYGLKGFYWSSSSVSKYQVWTRVLLNFNVPIEQSLTGVGRAKNSRGFLLSVRCKKD